MKLSRVAPFVFVLALGAAGCSDDEPAYTAAPLPECPRHDYAPCDTRDAGCQRRLLSLASCVYGAEDPPDVPVHVISEADFREALEAGLEEEQEARTEEDIASTELLESALVALRLVTPGALSDEASIDSLVESFVGVYQDAETGVILVDKRTPQNTPEADATLVHEFVHALQDADYDLQTWAEPYTSATDSLLAVRAVIEGEATYYGLRVGYAMLGHTPELTNWEGIFTNLRDDLDARAIASDSPYVAAAATFPYSYGGTLAYRAWAENGQGFEAALVEAPPTSTGSLLRELFPDDVPAAEDEAIAEPTATGDYALLDHEQVGSWLLRMLLVKFGLGDTDAKGLSTTWTGDQLWLYRDAEDRRAWLWQLQLIDESDAAEVASILEGELPSGVVLEQANHRLFVAGAASDDATPPSELVEAGQAFIELADGEN